MTPKERRKKRKEQKEVETPKKEEKKVDSKDPFKEITFIDKAGESKSISDVLDLDDFNLFEVKRKKDGQQVKKQKYLITYDGAKKLALAAGITGYHIDLLVAPTVENKMTTYLKITLLCPDCKHAHDEETEKLGEASNENTSSIASKYKGSMAEKRGFVRAVIDHLNLPNFYGEDEFSEDPLLEKEKESNLSKDEFEALAEILNLLINATNIKDLEDVGVEIKKKVPELSETQLEYLRRVYGERQKALRPAGF